MKRQDYVGKRAREHNAITRSPTNPGNERNANRTLQASATATATRSTSREARGTGTFEANLRTPKAVVCTVPNAGLPIV